MQLLNSVLFPIDQMFTEHQLKDISPEYSIFRLKGGKKPKDTAKNFRVNNGP